MKNIKKTNNFDLIFKELESKDSQDILQLTKEIKVIISQIEEQQDDLESISAASVDTSQMYFSTGT